MAIAEVGWLTTLLSLLGLALLAAVAFFVHGALFALLKGRGANGGLGRLRKRLHRPTHVALPLLAVALALPYAPLPPSFGQAAQLVITQGFIGVVGWLSIAAVQVISDMIMSRHDLSTSDNLEARIVHTQVRLVRRVVIALIVLLTLGAMLMVVPGVRALGVSVFASAGVAGLMLGMAAKPTFGNIIAGLQVAITKPIRVDDVVIVEGEWGRIEEIRSTYVVVRIWDERRLVVPLTYFIEKPFQNWTRETSDLIGAVTLHADYRVPVEAVREELLRILQTSPLWDGKIWNVQVVDAGERTVTLRALMSAANSTNAWDLRCYVREKLLEYLQRQHPDCLPRLRLASGDAAPSP